MTTPAARLTAGTRIETISKWPGVPAERAKIARPRRGESVPGPGWYIVRFDTGGALCMHEERFRVIDNHAGAAR
jgi:hypothetical protein